MSNGKRQQRIVAIDSNTLVWGVRRKGDPEKIKRAGYLFEELEEDEAQIILPSVAVAEYIIPLPDKEKVLAKLGKRFLIVPFDHRDALLAAELWTAGKSSRSMKQHGVRVCLRADAMIVASAKNHGATEFFTDDNDCFKLASKVMTAKHLPTMGTSLFDDLPDDKPKPQKAKTDSDDPQD